MELNNNIQNNIDNTVMDAIDLSNGAENAATNLVQDIENAKRQMGHNSPEFNSYQTGVAYELTQKGVLPELALGHAKNNFNDLDMDENGEISKLELYLKNSQSRSPIEKALNAHLIAGFNEIRSSHDSSQFIPFGSDKKGITSEDLDAILESQDLNREAVVETNEDNKEQLFVKDIASDMMADNGKMFLKLARGDRDSNRQTIEQDDLEDWLEKDDKAREYNSNFLSDREREVVSYLNNNWDSKAVQVLRSDTVEIVDADGTEKISKGTGDISIATVQSVTQRSLPRKELTWVGPEQAEVKEKESIRPNEDQDPSTIGMFSNIDLFSNMELKEVKPVYQKWPTEQESVEKSSPGQTDLEINGKQKALTEDVNPIGNEIVAELNKLKGIDSPAPQLNPNPFTDAQIQANTRAYMDGEPLPFPPEGYVYKAPRPAFPFRARIENPNQRNYRQTPRLQGRQYFQPNSKHCAE